MKIFGPEFGRTLLVIFLSSLLIVGFWLFQLPTQSKSSTSVKTAEPTTGSDALRLPVAQPVSKIVSSKFDSPETISLRAAAKVKEYAEVRRKLRTGELSELSGELAPPPLPEPIENPANP